MKCSECDQPINKDDNFCGYCGACTIKGQCFFKNNPDIIATFNKRIYKKRSKIAALFFLLIVLIVLLIVAVNIKGQDIMKPFTYLKKEILSLKYGYNVTLINNEHYYNDIKVNDYYEAKDLIYKDFSEQKYQCKENNEVINIEAAMEKDYNIINVTLCDMSKETAVMIEKTFNKVNKLFPNVFGYLTNISVTNAKEKDEYVAYFEAMHKFVDNKNQIINKNQILLNSYYFLNDKKLAKFMPQEWYVKDASWDSLIAHELGHYISFVAFLKSENFYEVVLVEEDELENYKILLDKYNSGIFAKTIVEEAYSEYNSTLEKEITIDKFIQSISVYAATKKNNSYVYDEIIAEAVHDYYLHEGSANDSSLAIIMKLKGYLT